MTEPEYIYPEANLSSGFFLNRVPSDRSSSLGWKE